MYSSNLWITNRATSRSTLIRRRTICKFLQGFSYGELLVILNLKNYGKFLFLMCLKLLIQIVVLSSEFLLLFSFSVNDVQQLVSKFKNELKITLILLCYCYGTVLILLCYCYDTAVNMNMDNRKKSMNLRN